MRWTPILLVYTFDVHAQVWNSQTLTTRAALMDLAPLTASARPIAVPAEKDGLVLIAKFRAQVCVLWHAAARASAAALGCVCATQATTAAAASTRFAVNKISHLHPAM